MIKITTRFSLLLSFLLIGGIAIAQSPFYAEDFSGGAIPDGWTNVDTSGNEVLWQYCRDLTTCPPATFNRPDGSPLFGNFGATSAADGYIYVDSDAGGELDTNHIIQLTTLPIDASAQDAVFLRFETHIATFSNNAAANAIVRVRSGSGTSAEWTTYTTFPNLISDEAETSANAAIVTLDISEAAAMSDSVYIQWQWTGNFEFSWSLDDIRVFGEEPANAPEGSVYYEDFGGGLGDWEVVSTLPDDGSFGWEYYPIPDVGNGAFAAEGTAIQSLSPENGAMVMNYDFLNTQGDPGNAPPFPYPDIISELISPVIDLSDVEQALAIEFSQLFRRLNPATGQFFSSYSISRDGGLTYEDPVDTNPTAEVNGDALNSRQYFPITGVAGEDSLRIKFTYAGDFYYWVIDDVTLRTRPDNDMQANENFFAVAPNAMTPVSQVGPVNFLVDIENVGGLAQENVMVNMSITNDSGAEVFTATENYGMITSDSIAENRIFAESFTPSGEGTESYTATYSVSSDATDFNPDNNSLEFTFAVSDTTFAKEMGGTGGVAPGADDSYTYGNVFHVPNGAGYFARYMSFSTSNADDLADAGKSVTTYIYEWDGTGGAELSIAPEDAVVVAFNSYTFTGNEGDGLITLPVDLDGNAIELKDNMYYIAAVQYETDDEETFFINVSRERDYQAMWFMSDSLDMSHYASALDVSNTGTLGLVGFGFGVVPVIRLHIGDNDNINQPGVTNTQVVLPAENKVAIFPNPVENNLNLQVNLTTATEELLVRVFDNQGRLVLDERYDNIRQTELNYSAKNLATGAYYLQIVTDAGVRTKRFVVQR
ncbi:MAG: T9SS type A sorting domain-containing protein [Saprospiraceae bacterium]